MYFMSYKVHLVSVGRVHTYAIPVRRFEYYFVLMGIVTCQYLDIYTIPAGLYILLTPMYCTWQGCFSEGIRGHKLPLQLNRMKVVDKRQPATHGHSGDRGGIMLCTQLLVDVTTFLSHVGCKLLCSIGGYNNN